MSRWCGKVGYALETVEIEPGVYESGGIKEQTYYGDLTSDRWRRDKSGKINDDINLSHVVSILADPFAYEHCRDIVYVEINKEKWKVTNVEIMTPRLQLTIGGVYK